MEPPSGVIVRGQSPFERDLADFKFTNEIKRYSAFDVPSPWHHLTLFRSYRNRMLFLPSLMHPHLSKENPAWPAPEVARLVQFDVIPANFYEMVLRYLLLHLYD